MSPVVPAPVSKSESRAGLHGAIVDWLESALPLDAAFHHSPTDRTRTAVIAARERAMGTRVGWPDLEIVHRGGIFCVYVIRRDTDLTIQQRASLDALRKADVPVCIARSAAQVGKFLARYMTLRKAPAPATKIDPAKRRRKHAEEELSRLFSSR